MNQNKIERRGFFGALALSPLAWFGVGKKKTDDIYEPEDGWKNCAFRYMRLLRSEKECRDLDNYIRHDTQAYLVERVKYWRERALAAEKELGECPKM